MQAHVALAGQRVRSARRRAGLTQLQLALAAGISVRTLRDVEHGQIRSLSSPAVGKVNEILGLGTGPGDPATADTHLSVGLLGPLTIRRGSKDVLLAAPKLRAALAILTLHAGRAVSRRELADAVWASDPPDSWKNALCTQVSRIRARTGVVIVLHGSAYSLQDATVENDALRFRSLVEEAGRTDPLSARRLLEKGLRCWRGPVLDDLDTHLQNHPAATELSRLRVRAAVRYADLALASGQAEQAAELLEPVAEQEALDETVQARLIAAVAAAGRPAAAITRYDVVRRRLADDLGIDPGKELQDVLHTVLTQRIRGGRSRLSSVPPAQMPMGTTEFTGRARQLAQMDALVGQHERGLPSRTAACRITGTAGVGKTALALHWAQRARDQFPDGQLYANLHGFGPLTPLDPTHVLDHFLRSLHVPAADLPTTVDAKSALLRSVLSGRRILLLLDNARNASQVRPLLPSGPPSLALITSRSKMAGLGVQEGVQEIGLMPFGPSEAAILLTRMAGSGQAGAELSAIDKIAEYCAGLPLALRIVGGRATRDNLTLPVLAEELRDASSRLDELSTPDDEASCVRTVFSWSYRVLPAACQRLFRLLALHAGPDFGVAAAAALAGLDRRRTRLLLLDLAGMNILEQPRPGRFALHDLLRAYAAELAQSLDTAATSKTALERLIAYYSSAAQKAVRIDATLQADPQERARAADWLDTEMSNVVALMSATHTSHPLPAMTLSAELGRYLETRGRHHDAVLLHTCAVSAAVRSGNQARIAPSLARLGLACWRLGRLEEAVGHYQKAMTAAESCDDYTTAARALTEMGAVCAYLGRHADAHQHSLQALEAARQIGDRSLQGKAVNTLGMLNWYQQDYDSALTRYQESLALAEAVDDAVGQANALSNIGHCLIGMERHTEALSQLTASLAISTDIGHVALKAQVTDSIAEALRNLGRYDEALNHHRQALDIARTTLDRNVEADILNGYGETSLRAGGTSAAIALHHQALAIATVSGDRRQMAQANEGIAWALRLGADMSGARSHLQDAISIYADIGVPRADQLRTELASSFLLPPC